MIRETFTDCYQDRYEVYSCDDCLEVEAEDSCELLFSLDRHSATVLRDILNQYLNEVKEDA